MSYRRGAWLLGICPLALAAVAVTQAQNSHELGLVGAAGFEATTSLELRQGALTAELHAYFVLHLKSMVSSGSIADR